MTWSGFALLEPSRLWLLALPVLLAGAYLLVQRRRAAYALRFTNVELLDQVAPDRPGWRRHVPAVLVVLALVALVVAVARPVVAEEVARDDAIVVLAIDVSLSMDATDVPPTRLEAAQRAAQAFLDEVPEGVRVGLVPFAGTATVEVPATDDIDALRRAVDRLALAEGTAIGDAILAALTAVADAREAVERERLDDVATGEPSPDAIVLLSDGETTVGTPDEVGIEAARRAGIPVHTIAFGTDDGVLVLPGQGAVPVPVNREALERIAVQTDGRYAPAATGDELVAVYEELGRETGRAEETRDVADRFAATALALLTLGAAASLRWFSRLP